MKKIFLLVCLAAVGGMATAQDVNEMTAVGSFGSGSFDAREFVEQSADDALPARQMAMNSPKTGAENCRWIDRMSNLPEYMQSFYDLYSEKITNAFNKQANWLVDPAYADEPFTGCRGVKVKRYTGSADFTFPEGLTTSDLRSYAYDAIKEDISAQWDDANCFFPFLCMSLTYDFPETFWINSYFRWSDSYTYNWSRHSATDGSVTYTHDVYFVVKDDSESFDLRRGPYNDRTKIFEDMDTYNEAIAGILSGIPTGADCYETIAYFNEWLTANNYYNPYFSSKTNTDLAWSPISALAGLDGKDSPVCEGYARAFMVLCEEVGIPCQLATGYAKAKEKSIAENHMWNEVMMDDENWYAMDVTWNDPYDGSTHKVSGKENTDWSLLGNNTIVPSGMVFRETHPNQITWSVAKSYLERWECNFSSFIADERYVHTASDGIAAIGSVGLVVRQDNGMLHVSGAQNGETISVYALDGRKIATAVVEGGTARLNMKGFRGAVVISLTP